MEQQIVIWVLAGAVSALATVLWWLGRTTIARLETNSQKLVDFEQALTTSIANLKVSVATDMGSIRERLARLEGHAGIGK